MRQNARCEQRFRELIGADLPPDELERLTRVDALLRVVAGREPDESADQAGVDPVRANLRLVATPSAATGSAQNGRDDRTHELKLTFGQLALVYKSLRAVRALGALPPQDELLNDTMQLVDLAMTEAV